MLMRKTYAAWYLKFGHVYMSLARLQIFLWVNMTVRCSICQYASRVKVNERSGMLVRDDLQVACKILCAGWAWVSSSACVVAFVCLAYVE
jgi:hypothetical protein